MDYPPSNPSHYQPVNQETQMAGAGNETAWPGELVQVWLWVNCSGRAILLVLLTYAGVYPAESLQLWWACFQISWGMTLPPDRRWTFSGCFSVPHPLRPTPNLLPFSCISVNEVSCFICTFSFISIFKHRILFAQRVGILVNMYILLWFHQLCNYVIFNRRSGPFGSLAVHHHKWHLAKKKSLKFQDCIFLFAYAPHIVTKKKSEVYYFLSLVNNAIKQTMCLS